jgi:protein required for attachment to host cells
MKTQGRWLIVMGRKSAKIFTVSDKKPSLKWIKTLQNPLGREKNKVMSYDKPGMSMGKYSKNMSPHDLTGGKNPHEYVAVEFAKKVSDFLKHKSEDNEFSKLTIAAESHMMGLIKKTFKAEKMKLDVEWVKKDLDKLTVKKIEAILLHHAELQ